MKQMTVWLVGIGLLILSGCSERKNVVEEQVGTFNATMGTTQYEVKVVCNNIKNFDQFTFMSDRGKFENGKFIDTDGDGVVVRGDRLKLDKSKSLLSIDGISIDITDQGVEYENELDLMSIGGKKQVNQWTKTANGVRGKTVMTKKGNDASFGDAMNNVINGGVTMTYEVTCK